MYLQQVKGSRGNFVLVLARRDGRARESLNRKDARERRQSTEWEVCETLSSDGEESLGQKAGHLPPAQEEGSVQT